MVSIVSVPTTASAQTGLLTEAARDPGRADVPQTARQLALGSVVASGGAADSAASVPSTLTLQTGSDFVFAAGSLLYARRELVLTPRTSSNDGPRRKTDAQPSSMAHLAAATRGANWAIAAFLDRSSGYSHEFKTDRNMVNAGYLFPFCFEVYSSGEARVNQSVTRSGGSIALGNSRAGVGVSVYGLHLDYLLQTSELLENVNCEANRPRTVSYEQRNGQLRFGNWATGLSISGHVGVGRTGSVVARWRREPRVSGRTTGGSRVDFNLPDTLSAAWITRTNALTFVGELSWHEYGAADFITYGFATQKLLCDGLDLPDASGKRVPCGMRSTFTVRSGLEHGVQVGKGRVLFRGGIAWEPGYTFAREAYPWGFGRVRGLSGQMRWDPPREDSIWISGGAAYARGHSEVGAGVGHADDQLRLLVDLRFTR